MSFLLFSFLFSFFIHSAHCQHKSFQDTVFDLDLNLPAEDPPPTTKAPPSTTPPPPPSTTTPAPTTTSITNQPTSTISASSKSRHRTVERPKSSGPRTVKRWFRLYFDESKCPRNEGFIGQQFRQKFPAILKNRGVHDKLGALLVRRLVVCHRKETIGHWQTFQSLLDTMEMTGKPAIHSTTLLDCRNGLLQEEIACRNLNNYSCQFISPSYRFKLVPVRLIVIEARLTKDGAQQCRPLMNKLINRAKKRQKVVSSSKRKPKKPIEDRLRQLKQLKRNRKKSQVRKNT